MKRISCILLVAFLAVFSSQGNVLAGNADVIIKEIKGLVQIQRGDELEWTKADESSTVTSGDKIRSFLESSALLVFPNGSEFRLRENTSLDIKDISQSSFDKSAKRELKLNVGSLQYKVPPKKEKATEFKIHSSTSIVGITGTQGVLTAKGKGKPSENILTEGATYNTDDQGQNGYYQKSGNVYRHDGELAQLFSADVREEVKNRMAINEEYVGLLREVVALYRSKRDEGYRVAKAEATIRQAFSYLEKREYDLVGQMTKRTKTLLEKARKIKIPEDIDEKMTNVAGMVNDKELEGYDVRNAYILLVKFQGLKQNGEFNEIRQILTQVEKELALLTEQERPVGQKQSFLSHYQNVQRRVLEKEQQGFALSEIKSILRQGAMFYEQGGKARAYQLLMEAEDELSLSLKNVSDAFKAKITRLQDEIAAKKTVSYPTKELELKLEKVKALIKEENFLKARELVSAIDDGLLTLAKNVSAEWRLKIGDFKRDVTYKRAMGYNLIGMSDLIVELERYQAQGDLPNLELTYQKAKEAFSKVTLPPGFEESWNAFLKQRDLKENLGYNLKDIKDLTEKIEAAIYTGDIKSARSFLAQAKKALNELKDQEPPKVQVLSFSETEDVIKIEGYARDNTKIRNVFVNNSIVKLSEDGKFLFKTVPSSSFKKISILAEDIEGNISAPVVLAIESQGETINGQADVKDARVEYLENTFVVKGKFVPGGKVKIGEIETICNDKGDFTARVYPGRNKANDSITVVGIRSEGVTTNEVVLTIEDKWAPRVKIGRVYFDNNFVPALSVDPLNYKESKLSVSGQVGIKQMANIEGSVFDLGGTIESLKVEGNDVAVREDGAFNASLTMDPSRKDLSVKIIARDTAGNTTETKAALDAIWNLPSVKINNATALLNSSGKFTKEILLTKDISDVVIILEDSKGETIISERLPVAAVLPPELEIQDIRHEGGNIYISGRTSSDATVSDKNKTLFKEDLEALKDTVFTLSAEYPPIDQEVIFLATNIEGKTSEEVKVVVGPPKDQKAPVLYLSSPVKEKSGIIVKGSVEDDSGIEKLIIQGANIEITERGTFSHQIESTEDLASVEISATDIFGNTANEVIALNDKEKPQIVIDTWEAKEGRLVITGKVSDNVGVKEVRLNDMPIALGSGRELAFSYDGALTGSSQDAVIIAVDLLNNETREGPREITIPTDTKAPKGKSIGLKYGSPIVYASGEVADPAGIKAVYVNGEEVQFFDDGTFDVKVSIDVGRPKVDLESPAYDRGKIIVAGKVAPGDFSPAKITVESEDLSGNRGVLFSRDVLPYQLSELEVAVNGQVIEVDDGGGFRYEQPIVLGEKTVEVKVQDPFDNSLFESLELESKKPVLNLNPLEYKADDETVILSGKAQDEGSGVYTVGVNGVRVEVSNDGSFSYRTTFNQGSLNVVAMDYIGNESSLTKEVNPPDIWPPVFSLNISPVPAIVGNPVYVEIAALDSKTRLPEILKNAPTVSASADGKPVLLAVTGEGANYMATLETAGLSAALVTVQVQGEDAKGNTSSEVEGVDVFALVTDDMIAPSFSVETVPSPVELGKSAKIKVYASEDLKVSPALEAVLPSGTASVLKLSSVNSGEYEASLNIPVEDGMGTIVLKLSGGEDLSGNIHETTETSIEVAAPVVVTAELPLNITMIEFPANRFVLSGKTASDAIVRIEAGKYSRDIVADAQGVFRFERPVSLTELQEMYARGPNIGVNLKAHNYAGFESRKKFFEVPLPPLPDLGGTNFEVRVSPSPAGQGEMINISVNSLKAGMGILKGFLYLPNGQRVLVNLQGRDVFTAKYTIPENSGLGTAMFEVLSGDVRESVRFDIVLSDKWMQKLNKYDFFKIRVSQDPLIIGQRAEFFVETMGDLPAPPRLQIMLPGGRVDNIPLSGSLRFFQGTYLSPVDLVPGRSELILNPGMPEEIRRPYGVEDKFSKGDYMDAFLIANPNPLIGGKPYDVNLSFSQDIPFKPRLVLKLQNGRIIEMPLDGSAPSNKFVARGTLSNDVETGLAKFVVFDDRGMVIDQFPARVSAPFATSTGIDIFVVPDVLHRMDRATIQLNSIISLYGRVEAHVSYPDGTKIVMPLEGSGTLRKGMFTVPDYVPLGMVTISVFNEGRSLGTISARIVEHGEMRGPVHIFLDKPDFKPFEFVRLNVEANWPLTAVPKAELLWDGGSLKIFLNGQIPGNKFMGEFMAPKNPIERGRIEIRDDKGMILGDFPLDHGPEGKGEIIVTPMPPVMGQPLSIKVMAPSIVNSAPTMRLIFQDGEPVVLNAYGPIPGNTFTASLASLERPLRMIEIIHEGRVIESIPVEYLSMFTFEFFVDILDEVSACEITDVIIRSNNYVPFTPYLSVDFQGRIVDVSLSKMSPTEFLGKISVPCDVNFDSYNMRVFDPQGKLLWQRNFSHYPEMSGLFNLNVMPIDAVSVKLSWNMLPGIENYEIRYGETAALGRTIFAGNVSQYTLSNLKTGQIYFFKLAARKDYKDIMVSDIIQVTIGSTTRELNVQANIMGNAVHLFWTEYAGADTYRVLWGTAAGTYPNMVDVAATSYYIPGLATGGNYNMKVRALQNGGVIGESRNIFIHIEEFVSSGGDIRFIPDPPVVGQYLEINMRFFQDLPFVPKVMVRLQNRDVTLTPTGQYRDYKTYLMASAFDSPIMVIDVLDPNGRIIASRSPTAGTHGGPMVPIVVIPDPPMIGSSLQVKVNPSPPPPFTPRLVVEFASGVKEYNFNQAPYMDMYDVYIPVADMYSSILYMKVMNPDTGAMIGERIFSGQSDWDDAPFVVTPNPPIVGLPVEMDLDTGTIVSLSPKLRIYFASGMQEVTMMGSLPGQHFIYDIGYLNSPINYIDIVDPLGVVKHTWQPGVAGPMSCQVVLQYDPPMVGQMLQVRADFPWPVPYVPRVLVELQTGFKSYTFPQGPNLKSYEISIPAADITSTVKGIEIRDNMNNLLLCERLFDATPIFVQSLTVAPQPPIVNQSLQVHVEFNTYAGFTPKWSLDTMSGLYEGNFTQGPGLRIYDQTIASSYLASPVMELEILDNFGNVISNGRLIFNVDQYFTCTATFSPNPPMPYASLVVTADYSADNMPSYIPWVFIEFDNGSTWSQVFPQAASMQHYEMTIPGTYITGYVSLIDIASGSGGTGTIDCGMDFAVGTLHVNLSVNPDPPVPGTDLLVTANFSNYVPFIPRLSLDLSDATFKEYIFPDAAGLMSYQITIPASDITSFVDRIVIEDNLGHEIMSDLIFSGGSTTVEYPTGLWKETTGVPGEIKIHWNSVAGVDGYRVYYGTASQTYNASGSPLEIADPGATQAVISSLFDNVLYYITVDAYIGTIESNNPNEVSAYPGTGGGGGTLTADVTTLNISGNAGASIPQQSVTITNNGTSAVNVRAEPIDLVYGTNTISTSNYMISPSSISIVASASSTFTIDLSVPAGSGDGLYAGSIKFYADADSDSIHDDGEAFVNVSVSLTVSSVDHVRITADATSSTMGSPIFVTLRAEDSGNNIVTSYATDVTINVQEMTPGSIPNSWILSTNDGPGGSSSSTVEMFGGLGNFTVDAQEPGILRIYVSGITSVPGSLDFGFEPSVAGSSAVDFVIIGPNRAPMGSGSDYGASVWIAAIDGEGRVVTNYTGTASYTVTGSAAVYPASPYTITEADKGQFQVIVEDTVNESVTLQTTSPFTKSLSIEFAGVTQYLVYEGGSAATAFTTKGTTIKLTLRAADGSGNIVRSYNKDATFTTGDVDAYLDGGSSIVSFKDGLAEITLNNSTAPEVVTFSIDENIDPTIDTDTITADFQSSDASAPEIVRVEMDTPWIVHVYFNEDIDSVTGGEESYYDVGVTINKVCWYVDNVTLHLNAIPGGGLGTTFNLTIDGVKDTAGNAMSSVSYNNIPIPNVDFQGSPGSGGDWFEVQVSDTTPAQGDTVHVTVYHKNVCGYLTGSNKENKNVTLGFIDINYTGSLGIGGLSSSPLTSVDISSGRAEFDVTVGSSPGTVTISASGGSVTTQISSTLTIP